MEFCLEGNLVCRHLVEKEMVTTSPALPSGAGATPMALVFVLCDGIATVGA